MADHQPGAPFEARPTPDGLKLTGDLDLTTAEKFTAALPNAYENGGYRLTLDLSELDFIDSSGFHAIVEAVVDAKGRGWTLTISPQMRDQVQRAFEISGLLGFLPFAEG